MAYKELDEWRTKYCPDSKNMYLAGSCPDSDFGHSYALKTCYNIAINHKIKRDSLFYKCVLWHEFCHCWDYHESGSMGHELKWIKKHLHKPLYVIGTYVLFPMAIYYMVMK